MGRGSILAQAQGQLARSMRDVSRLEVNTILKPALRAVTPPNALEAIADVVGLYRRWFALYPSSRLSDGVDRAEAERLVAADGEPVGWRAPDDVASEPGLIAVDRLVAALHEVQATATDLTRTLEAIDQKADDGPAESPHTPANTRRRNVIMASRIERNARVLVDILTRYQAAAIGADLPSRRRKTKPSGLNPIDAFEAWLTTDDRLRIRKIWEIGTADIAMQSVIQIDGDVVTYVQPYYARDTHHAVHALHYQSVQTSITMWSTLIGTISAFVTGLVGLVTARRAMPMSPNRPSDP